MPGGTDGACDFSLEQIEFRETYAVSPRAQNIIAGCASLFRRVWPRRNGIGAEDRGKRPDGESSQNPAARPGFATNPPKARQSIFRNDSDWRVSVKPVAEAGLHLVVLQAAIAI